MKDFVKEFKKKFSGIIFFSLEKTEVTVAAKYTSSPLPFIVSFFIPRSRSSVVDQSVGPELLALSSAQSENKN